MSDPSSQPTQPLTDAELARIEKLAPQCSPGTQRLIATIQETRGALAVRRLEADRLRALVLDLYQANPCGYDHHGYCQEHGWFETEPACPHSRVRALGLDQDGRGQTDA